MRFLPVSTALALAIVLSGGGCGRIGYQDRAAGDVDGPEADATDAPPDVPVDARVDGTIVYVCPNGMTDISPTDSICIDVNERGNADYLTAAAACDAQQFRLCTDTEWYIACTQGVGINEMANDGGGATPEWEWVADLVDATTARKRGYASCDDTSQHATSPDPYDYRCCSDKIPIEIFP